MAAQQADQLILLDALDSDKIEKVTFQHVNMLRIEQGLPCFAWDETLYLAAQNHANYLLKKEALSHSQRDKRSKSPMDRVEMQGGFNYNAIGENLVAVTLGTQYLQNGQSLSTVTYHAAGRTMALMWKASSGHYKNIITPEYNTSGLAVAYDSISQRLIAVQVFGYSNASDEPRLRASNETKRLSDSAPLLPHRLKEYRPKPKDQTAMEGFKKLKIDRGYLVGEYKLAKKVFKGRRDGICQEFVPIADYDSASSSFVGEPNRRNGLHELNGRLSKPAYRRAMLKYSRQNGERPYVLETKWIKIKGKPKDFIYPLNPNSSSHEYNLFFIKDRRLLSMKTYMMVPSKSFDLAFPKMKYATSFNSYIPYETKQHTIQDTLSFRVYYKSMQTKIDSNRLAELQDELKQIDGTIISVEASAYASVEGDSMLNAELAKDRMKDFLCIAEPWTDQFDFHSQIRTGENWNLLFDQVENGPLAFISMMRHEEIREYLNKNASSNEVAALLDAQRYVEFQLISRHDTILDVHSQQHPADAYDSLLTVLGTIDALKSSFIKELEKAQLRYYYYLKQNDKENQEPLLAYPIIEKNPQFEYHDLIFRYTVRHELTDQELYAALHRIAYAEHFPSRLKKELLYNNQLLIYNSFEAGKLNKLVSGLSCKQIRQEAFYFRAYEKVECGTHTTNSDLHVLSELPRFINLQKRINRNPSTYELRQYYYLHSIATLNKRVPYDKNINRYLRGFEKYFHPNNEFLTDEERLKYAYFYGTINQHLKAKEIIEPIAVREVPHPKALKMYMALKFDDFNTEHEYSNYLISQFPRLGKEEWCDIWVNPEYFNAQLLENLRLKDFYNCNCQ